MPRVTKQEVYKSIINIQKETGQGLAGIVKVKSADYDKYIDELIEEGLVIRCESGGSLGHPESNRYYMPTKGYNVWLDNEGEYSRFKGRNLHKVRFYLGCFPFEEREPLKDKQDELKRKHLRPTMFDYIRDPQWMEEYHKWLVINKDELEVMRNLDTYYDAPIIEFTDEEVEYIQTRSWYTDNKTIGKCLKMSEKVISKEEKRLSITREIIVLYKSNKAKYKKELAKSESEVEEFENFILGRRKINKWLDSQDSEGTIQELFEQHLTIQ